MIGISTRPARVMLVGFEDQDNLGLRYLSSSLKQRGHRTSIVTISGGPGPVLDAVWDLDPDIVGFSLIFQYLVPQFAELLAQLNHYNSLMKDKIHIHTYKGSSWDLGLACAKPYMISIIGVINEGDSALLSLRTK